MGKPREFGATMWHQPTKSLVFDGMVALGAEGELGTSIRLRKGQIAALDFKPSRTDHVCHLDGALMIPGLINAHDHLELNGFSPLKWRDCYANVSEWIADFQPRFDGDPDLASGLRLPIEARLLQGGLKNLLSGATTVCHHNPWHSKLSNGFPVRVLRRYRFNHSLRIDGDKVALGYAGTPRDWPWIIHAAEGTDEEAREEIRKLDRLNCLGSNTLIVHGVALEESDASQLAAKGCALIWCPSSNFFLLGTTAPIGPALKARRLALGTDSRLSGSRDLLEEMQVALSTTLVDARSLFRIVTADAASILRASEAGAIAVGRPADLVVIQSSGTDPYSVVSSTDRARLRLVMVGGRPRIGDRDLRNVFEACGVEIVPVVLDGRPKLLDAVLAGLIRRSGINEPGLEFST